MSRAYSIPFIAVAVSGAVDLFELAPADDKPIEIVGIEIGQSSDAGDAQDENLYVSIIRGHATSGSGGSSATPAPKAPGGAAASFTAEVCNTTVASAGTGVTLGGFTWNVRAGYINWFPEGDRYGASQANGTIVFRQSSPADSITMTGTLHVRELG